MKVLNKEIKKIFGKPTKEEWQWIALSILIGLFCHGAVIFNNLIFHDDSALRFGNIGYEMSMVHGRWFTALLFTVSELLAGDEGISSFFGLISLLLIAMSTILALRLYNIKKKASKVTLILILNTIPYVTSNFGYMSSTIYNFIGIFVCICGVAMVCISSGCKDIFLYAGIVLISMGIGEYQCFLPFCASLLLLYLIKEILDDKREEKRYLYTGLKYLGVLLVSLALYLGILQFALYITQTKLSSYAGTDTYGIVPFKEYLQRAVLAYKYFIDPMTDKRFCMFPFKLNIWHMGLLLILFIGNIYLLFGMFRNGKKKAAYILLMTVVLFPLAVNSNFLLYEASSVHGLHMYTYMCVFLLLAILLEKAEAGRLKWFYKCGTIWVGIIGVLYFRYAGLCYLNMDIAQEKAKAYFITMVTRIQSIEGYDDSYSILYINPRQKNTDIFPESISTSDYIITNPLYETDIPNNYMWYKFMYIWTGYASKQISEPDPAWEEEIERMASYPNDGSIKIFDDVIVVKF